MKYPTYPKSDAECRKYAEYLESIRDEKFIPMRRREKYKTNSTINYAAVEEYELVNYLQQFEVI